MELKVNSKLEWIEIQKYLFNLGYKWCDNTQRIIQNDNYGYPDYILIEINYKDLSDNLMFSYSHIPIENSVIHNACQLLRKNKLIEINGK